ncbi:hypothetical protein [Plesiomonas shigelloides]|uniref:hypothetical protein n=1 Tax=Plesiomonas shigelloides TaxID=703 RepID=UPI00387F0BEA
MAVLSVRVTDEQKREIELIAKSKNITTTEYLRQIINNNQAKNQLETLQTAQQETEESIQALKSEVEILAARAGRVAIALSDSLIESEDLTRRIRIQMSNENFNSLVTVGALGWALSFVGSLWAMYLMS